MLKSQYQYQLSPMLTTQAVALATTAAMAVSSTVILLVIRFHQKNLPENPCFRPSTSFAPTSAAEDEGTRGRGEKQSSGTKRRKKSKRVSFADPVVHVRKRSIVTNKTSKSSFSLTDSSWTTTTEISADRVNRGMPANRTALYNGILRDRLNQRVAYSY